ncbi:Muskelin [Spraguea lophii 42_110]|uniref:Muskelin n=1 Tax=Spraguea lophii (strain 42_110) TaxID=1358809 RepID=S7WA44_SPRLO|nr:Muskelin [Spraguea lophii 42_110]
MFTNYKNTHNLGYNVHDYSSFSSKNYPYNILIDNPLDSTSRWTTGHSDETQYITLKLNKPSIITNIIFGKYVKIHSCNTKNLEVFSMQNGQWHRILAYRLRNDTEEECVCVSIENNNKIIISEYIKIIPSSSWGMNYTYSLWYVAFRGYDNNLDVFLKWNMKIVNETCSRIVLKYLRENNFHEEYKMLEKKVGTLECRELKIIRKFLIENKMELVEDEIIKCRKKGMFKEYVDKSGFNGKWTPLLKTHGENLPSKRGGHQMVYADGKMFLLGGFNGREELGDLWVFEGRWKLVSNNTRQVSGPGKRSCHKMVYSKNRNALFVIGRFYQSEYHREKNSLKFEIFKYDITNDLWSTEIDSKGLETEVENFFDHQMVLDIEEENIYIVGGKITIKSEQYYGGIYVYNFKNKTLTTRRYNTVIKNTPKFKGRVGHNLIYISPNHFQNKNYNNNSPGFSPESFNNSLVIIAGVRNREVLYELLFYSIPYDTIYRRVTLPAICTDRSISRAGIVGDNIFCLFSVSKDLDGTDGHMELYSYSLIYKRWQEVKIIGDGPYPRSAHQFLYNVDGFYLFGGKKIGSGEERLNDMWKLVMYKEDENVIERRIIFLIRKYKFLLLVAEDEIQALEYLQTKVYESVDHSNEEEVSAFKKLCCEIFYTTERKSIDFILNEISDYFPEKCREPIVSIESSF